MDCMQDVHLTPRPPQLMLLVHELKPHQWLGESPGEGYGLEAFAHLPRQGQALYLSGNGRVRAGRTRFAPTQLFQPDRNR